MFRTIILTILVLSFSPKLLCQEHTSNKYIYSYEVKHPGVPGYFYISKKKNTTAEKKSNLNIKLGTSDIIAGITEIIFISEKKDSLVIDFTNKTSVKLEPGSYSFECNWWPDKITGFINIDNDSGFVQELVLIEGINYKLHPIIVKSKRELSANEVNEIVDMYIRNSKSKLVKNNTCRVFMQL